MGTDELHEVGAADVIAHHTGPLAAADDQLGGLVDALPRRQLEVGVLGP
jgi:hypothetical protein